MTTFFAHKIFLALMIFSISLAHTANIQMPDMKSSYGGVGIVCEKTEDGFKILSVIERSPAARAEIIAGDFIWAVDHIEVMNWDLQKLVKNIRGEIGTKVELTIHRWGMEEFTVSLTREQILYP